MTIEWLLRALAAGVLLAGAALAAERVAGWFGLPRRWAWAAAMAGSLLLPALALAAPGALPELGLPGWLRTSRPAAAAPDAIASGSGAAETLEAGAALSAPRPLPRPARIGWLAASLALLGGVAWSHGRLRRVRGGCVPGRVDGARVLLAERAGPMVLGVLRPAVVLPRWVLDAPAEERRLIVRHESEHVRGGDHRLLALATLAVAAMPWSPALWWMHRRLRLAVETDCDARVLAAGASRRLYGRVLLRTAERPPFLPVLALAWGERTSHLERRILAMTATQPRHRLLRALSLAAVSLAVAAAACDISTDGTAALATQPGAPRTRTEAWNGRTVTTTDYPDGTTSVTVAPKPGPPQGTLGMSYGWDERIVVSPGDTPPHEFKTFPVVKSVVPGAPAAEAGLAVGDVILSSNGVSGRTPPLFRDRRPGAEYTLRIRRGAEERDVRLVVGPPPATY